MDTRDKLDLLGGQAQFDLACACGDSNRVRRGDRFIYPAVLPRGGRVFMLKVLLDNSCRSDCAYCAQRAGRNTPRGRFAPEELARLFDQLYRAGRVEALFLSSGLGANPVRSMDGILATAEILRRRLRFRGFMHLKILPGAQRAQVEQAARLAQRISINLEVPGPRRLAELSRSKDYHRQVRNLSWINEAVGSPHTLARGHTTQFVVGAAGESDRELVTTSSRLYQRYGLSRAYYSAFQPVPDTPLDGRAPTPPLREHRLYQVDFLLRKYGFDAREVPFDEAGNLSLDEDPKSAWARLHPEFFPLEVNRADPLQLLRVPGIGPVGCRRLVRARRRGRLGSPECLARLGISARAAPYLLFDGKPARGQLSLFRTVG